MSDSETAYALDVLAVSYRINKNNLRKFRLRLDALANIGRELRAGNCTAEGALVRAEAIGFIAPLNDGGAE